MSRDNSGDAIAPGVFRISNGFVNCYLIGEAKGQGWAIVDTGMPGMFRAIRDAAFALFGASSRPTAIYLTHGHSDHAGTAAALAAYYDVPIYSHRMELPFLDGRSDYPPGDPVVGGPMGMAARLFPTANAGRDLRPFVAGLPEASAPLPGLDGWEIVETPGHTPGQVSFFRRSDRVLLAGDVLCTFTTDTIGGLLSANSDPHIARPPAPFTSDWLAARRSLERVADLRPLVIAPGHGKPMYGEAAADELRMFADDFSIPHRGRYVTEPAITDTEGIVSLPRTPKDVLPAFALTAAISLAALGVATTLSRREKSQRIARI